MKKKCLIIILFLFCCFGWVLFPGECSAQWVYKSQKDDMRGTAAKMAFIKSKTVLQFDFPYQGGSFVRLGIRKDTKNDDLSVWLDVSKGQFLYHDRDYAVKFDDDEIQSFSTLGSSSGRSDIVFLEPADKFIERLRTAKKVIIGLNFIRPGHVRLPLLSRV
jgi:hypothetical protein